MKIEKKTVEEMISSAVVTTPYVLRWGWCLIREVGGEQDFFLHANNLKYPAVDSRGEIVLRDTPQNGQRVEPGAGDEILVLAQAPAPLGRQYPCATTAIFRGDGEKVLASAKKWRETQARLARENAEANRRREEGIARARQMKGQGKGGGRRHQKAGH